MNPERLFVSPPLPLGAEPHPTLPLQIEMPPHALRWPHHLVVAVLSLFFLLWFIPYYEGLLGASASLDSPNEKTRVLNVASIGLYRELHINRTRGMWWCRETDLAGRRSRPSDGANAPHLFYYPGKTPGMALMLGPLYGAYRWVFGRKPPTLFEVTYFSRLFGVIIPMLLFAMLFYAVLLHLCASRYVILTGYAVFFLGNVLYPYALVVSSHTFASGLLFALFVALWRPARRPWQRAIYSFGAGFGLGLAFGSEYTAVLSGVIIGILGLFIVPPHRLQIPAEGIPSGWRAYWHSIAIRWHLGFVLLGSLLPALAVLWYHQRAFGHPFAMPYYHLLNPTFQHLNQQGFFGYRLPQFDHLFQTFFSSHYGLFFWTPFLLFALPAFIVLLRRAKLRKFGFILLLLCGLWCLYTMVQHSPRGGWTVGPRYIANIVPFLLLAAIWYVDRLYRRFGNKIAILIALTAVWSIVWNAPVSAYFPHLPEHSKFALVEIFATMWRGGLSPMNLLGLSAGWANLIYFGVLTGVCLYVSYAGLIGQTRKYAYATVTLCLLLAALVVFQVYPLDYHYRKERLESIQHLIPAQYRW